MDDNIKYLGGADHALFLQCYAASDTDSLVPIDCDHSDTALTMRGFMGCIKVLNRTTDVTSRINFSGYCEIDSSCTAGHFDMSGDGDCIDNSTGTAVVDTTKLTHSDEIADKVRSTSPGLSIDSQQVADAVCGTDDAKKLLEELLGKAIISEDELTVTIYSRSDDTVSHQFTISADKSKGSQYEHLSELVRAVYWCARQWSPNSRRGTNKFVYK